MPDWRDEMGKKQYVALAAAGGALFAFGFLAGTVWNRQSPVKGAGDEQAAENTVQEQTGGDAMVQERNDSPEAAGYVKADDIRVRIEDGQVQWYDGRSWHEVSSAKDLEQEDRFCLAQESFRAFDQQLRQEKEAKRLEEAAELSEELSAGVKETPKPVNRPAVPQAPAATPEPETQPETPPADNGGGGNPGYQPPAAPPPAATPTPAPETPPADTGGGDTGGDDTGDGENMSWSDDYL